MGTRYLPTTLVLVIIIQAHITPFKFQHQCCEMHAAQGSKSLGNGYEHFLNFSRKLCTATVDTVVQALSYLTQPIFVVGQQIEVKCTDGNWYRATLLQYNEETEECEIHFPESDGQTHRAHPDLLIRNVW